MFPRSLPCLNELYGYVNACRALLNLLDHTHHLNVRATRLYPRWMMLFLLRYIVILFFETSIQLLVTFSLEAPYNNIFRWTAYCFICLFVVVFY